MVSGESDIKGLRDLKGRTIGVQSGSTAQETLVASDLYSDDTMVPLQDNVTLLQKLEEGSVDAVFLDSIVAYYFIAANNKEFYVIPGNLEQEDYAIGFRKGDDALRDKVDEVIDEMKADGSLAEISKKWFGSDITLSR